MMLLFNLGNIWNLTSPPAPVSTSSVLWVQWNKWKCNCNSGLIVWGKPVFLYFFLWCWKNLITLPSSFNSWKYKQARIERAGENKPTPSSISGKSYIQRMYVLLHVELFCSQASGIWMDFQTCVRAQWWDYFQQKIICQCCSLSLR